jgi:hypothetical protein
VENKNMAEAYQCERCKQFDVGKPAGSSSVRRREEVGPTKFVRDLCATCSDMVERFIDTPPSTKPVEDSNAMVLRALKNLGIDTECAACMERAFTGTVTTPHKPHFTPSDQ